VWHDAFGEPTKLIYCDVQPVIFVVSTNELSMLTTLSCDGINRGVRGVQLDNSVGNLSGEVHHVVVNDDVGFARTVVNMVGMVCWEAFSSLVSV
jgi:hypothetical protein